LRRFSFRIIQLKPLIFASKAISSYSSCGNDLPIQTSKKGSEMGMKKTRREAFYRAHPTCIFCGGTRPIETIEHCPPRSMFKGRVGPEGFEFPACTKCNLGSSNDDLVVALLARSDPLKGSDVGDPTFRNLAGSIRQVSPGLLGQMYPSVLEARRLNRRFGMQVPSGLTQQQTGVAKIPAGFHRAIEVFASKLGKAIFYKETGKIFPDSGELLMRWMPNGELFENGKYELLDILADLPASTPIIKRGSIALNDQFTYKLTKADDGETFAIQAVFGTGFALVIFGTASANQFNQHRDELMRLHGRTSSFTSLPLKRE
jgi:hypothetical protein